MLIITKLGHKPETLVEPLLEEAAKFSGLTRDQVGALKYTADKDTVTQVITTAKGAFLVVTTPGVHLLTFSFDAPDAEAAAKALENEYLKVLREKRCKGQTEDECSCEYCGAEAEEAWAFDLTPCDEAEGWRVRFAPSAGDIDVWREVIKRLTGTDPHGAEVEFVK